MRLKAPESSALKLIELSYAEWLDELINPARFYEQNRLKPGFKTKPLIIPDDFDTMVADEIGEAFESGEIFAGQERESFDDEKSD